MLAIATILLPTFSKPPPLFIECSRSFRRQGVSVTIETVAFEIASSVPSLWRQHAVTITVLTEISRSKREEAALAFLYLAYALLEPNFFDFHDIVHSCEVVVMAASGRKRIPRLECVQVNIIPWIIG